MFLIPLIAGGATQEGWVHIFDISSLVLVIGISMLLSVSLINCPLGGLVVSRLHEEETDEKFNKRMFTLKHKVIKSQISFDDKIPWKNIKNPVEIYPGNSINEIGVI